MIARPPAPRELIRVSEAAALLGVCPETIRRRIADGSLIGHRLAGRGIYLVKRDEIERAIAPVQPAGGN